MPGPGLSRWRRTWLAAAVATLAALVAAPAADAGPIADKRAEADRVTAQIHEFDMRLGAAIERWNGARAELVQVRARIRENERRLAIARRNLRASRARLAAMLVDAYKGGDTDVAAYVLAAGSFSELVDRIGVVDRVAETQGDLLEQIARTEREIERRGRQLRADERRARELVAEAKRHRADIERGLRERQRLLGSIQADIRRLVAEAERRRERRARLAAARAARAAAAAEARREADRRAAARAEERRRQGTRPQRQSAPQPQPESQPDPEPAPAPEPEPAPPPPPSGSAGQQAVQVAMQYLGVPYVWGGASPSGFDCSGLTMYAYAQVGISLPHFTGAQWNSGAHVSRSQLAPGDLVFFYSGLSHVGLYVGGGTFVHAPHTGDVVKLSSLNDSWYASEFQGGVRVTG